MIFRTGTLDDCGLLAEMNWQLIRDEGHRNRMPMEDLEGRMREWLSHEYQAVIFSEGEAVVAYALYRVEPEEVYLRQLFVVRPKRRQGVGRAAIDILRKQIWPQDKRLTVNVITTNPAAIGFWKAMGYSDYCLTLEILPPAAPGS